MTQIELAHSLIETSCILRIIWKQIVIGMRKKLSVEKEEIAHELHSWRIFLWHLYMRDISIEARLEAVRAMDRPFQSQQRDACYRWLCYSSACWTT